jgi:tRNA (guanine37-N1)-methyltransferase
MRSSAKLVASVKAEIAAEAEQAPTEGDRHVSRRVYCALVHHPVKDRDGATVATSITNLDVHDIARSSRTYGLAGYYLVSPISAQHAIVDRILDHWRPGQAGAGRVPQRAEALRLIEVTRSIEESIAHIQEREGQAPRVWATGARAPEGKATPVLRGGVTRAA